MRTGVRKECTRLIVVLFASFLLAIDIKIFVRAGGLVPGGVTGLVLILQRACAKYFSVRIAYTPINLLLNAIPIYIGFRFIGKKFTLYSMLMIVASSFFIDLIPAYVLTNDVLLTSIFGGILNGVAVGLCLLVDATSGGTDFIAIYFSQEKGKDSFNLILVMNAILLCVAGTLFGWQQALYSIIFQYVSTQMLHLLYRNYQQQTLFIITNHASEVAKMIYRECHHGATIIDAKGSFDDASRQIVYSVVSGEENNRVIRAVHEIDPGAFINSIRTTEVRGSFYLRPHD
jgi:uncharacterized membrane-anchored protein YitT (DUF2179 family)